LKLVEIKYSSRCVWSRSSIV